MFTGHTFATKIQIKTHHTFFASMAQTTKALDTILTYRVHLAKIPAISENGNIVKILTK